MKKITASLLGAGMRGGKTFGGYALSHPEEIKFVAVAEPNPQKRKQFAKNHSIPEEMCFESYEQLLEKPQLSDALLVCTQDRMHFMPAIKALKKGYHILVEKPMATTPLECIHMGEMAKESQRLILVCHVLRYTPFFSTIKELLDKGTIGELVSIQHNENICYWHMAHSYVRGNWRNSEESSPIILAKSCHDLDILLWLANSNCKSLSSFGSLAHFKKEMAPEGAPVRCLDGCPASENCLYYAPNQYLTENIKWPTAAICTDLSLEGRTKALKEGPYGRCVYHCDNDVVDHQVVNMEFENGVTTAFTMCAFTQTGGRTIKLMGTMGEIRGHLRKNKIEVLDFNSGKVKTITPVKCHGGHSGGDYGIMKDFVRLVQNDGNDKGKTSADVSVQSHIMAFAAEQSRLTHTVIDVKEYMEGLKK